MRIPNLFFKTKTMKEKDTIFILILWMLAVVAYYWRHELENINIWIKILLWLLIIGIIIYECFFSDYSTKTPSEIEEERVEKNRRKLKMKVALVKLKRNTKKFFKELWIEYFKLTTDYIKTLLIIWIIILLIGVPIVYFFW